MAGVVKVVDSSGSLEEKGNLEFKRQGLLTNNKKKF